MSTSRHCRTDTRRQLHGRRASRQPAPGETHSAVAIARAIVAAGPEEAHQVISGRALLALARAVLDQRPPF
jgi:hypothetical protein